MPFFTKNIKIRLTGFLAALVFSMGLSAAEPVSKSDPDGIAIGGKDTVAYHGLVRAPQQSASAGAKQFSVEYKGALWQFSNQENADLFISDPARFSPAYNGHCANALSLGRGLLATDGATWEIFGDQLYLYFAPRGRERWLGGDWQAFKVKADEEWAKLSK